MTPKKISSEKAPGGADKGEARRQQVLDAATECFRREGFHGTSIARICQVAGMSPGHIYHYFENKEAIVEAIADRERNDLAGILAQLPEAGDAAMLISSLISQTPQMVERAVDATRAGLMLELATEAVRNPSVRDILQQSDEEIRGNFFRKYLEFDRPAGMSEAELQSRMEMVAVLMMGITLRSVHNPTLDVAAMTRLVQKIITFLLTPEGAVAAPAGLPE